MRNKYAIRFLIVGAAAGLLTGCAGNGINNRGMMPTYAFTNVEAEWIRNGEPIEFEGQKWYPMDGIDSLTDAEVMLMGEYREVKFFIDKIDVRPYDRLYTKFGVNKYRYFEKKLPDKS